MQNETQPDAQTVPARPAWTRPNVPPPPLKVIGTALRWIESNRMAFETAKMTREEANSALSRHVGMEISAESFALLLDAADLTPLWIAPERPAAPPGDPLADLAAEVRQVERLEASNRSAIEHNARKLADLVETVKELQRKLDVQGNAITKLARQMPSGDRNH